MKPTLTTTYQKLDGHLTHYYLHYTIAMVLIGLVLWACSPPKGWVAAGGLFLISAGILTALRGSKRLKINLFLVDVAILSTALLIFLAAQAELTTPAEAFNGTLVALFVSLLMAAIKPSEEPKD